MSECCVYVIGNYNNENLPVKVGIARHPDMRAAQIQTACPFKVEVLASWNFPSRRFARHVEASFHIYRSDVRLSGEWFAVHWREASSEIESICYDLCWQITDGDAVRAANIARKMGLGIAPVLVRSSEGGVQSWQ